MFNLQLPRVVYCGFTLILVPDESINLEWSGGRDYSDFIKISDIVDQF